ncbi:hypothetical protein CBR_g19296 [Chara braunii]|uniref:C2 NT-type domain-containing protein n=1 Tax=Chara braunii TaxID=69332 RepID=A0A388KXJ9_CHABU|nr:hypothetical protein CBR_g19296 [Chara braunii]|eukprot:GBG74784.1 hypothetical protein CBR_g19296 [Chara braunii]
MRKQGMGTGGGAGVGSFSHSGTAGGRDALLEELKHLDETVSRSKQFDPSILASYGLSHSLSLSAASSLYKQSPKRPPSGGHGDKASDASKGLGGQSSRWKSGGSGGLFSKSGLAKTQSASNSCTSSPSRSFTSSSGFSKLRGSASGGAPDPAAAASLPQSGELSGPLDAPRHRPLLKPFSFSKAKSRGGNGFFPYGLTPSCFHVRTDESLEGITLPARSQTMPVQKTANGKAGIPFERQSSLDSSNTSRSGWAGQRDGSDASESTGQTDRYGRGLSKGEGGAATRKSDKSSYSSSSSSSSPSSSSASSPAVPASRKVVAAERRNSSTTSGVGNGVSSTGAKLNPRDETQHEVTSKLRSSSFRRSTETEQVKQAKGSARSSSSSSSSSVSVSAAASPLPTSAASAEKRRTSERSVVASTYPAVAASGDVAFASASGDRLNGSESNGGDAARAFPRDENGSGRVLSVPAAEAEAATDRREEAAASVEEERKADETTERGARDGHKKGREEVGLQAFSGRGELPSAVSSSQDSGSMGRDVPGSDASPSEAASSQRWRKTGGQSESPLSVSNSFSYDTSLPNIPFHQNENGGGPGVKKMGSISDFFHRRHFSLNDKAAAKKSGSDDDGIPTSAPFPSLREERLYAHGFGRSESLVTGRKLGGFFKWKPLRALARLGHHRSACTFSLHVRGIENMSFIPDGKMVIVRWKRKETCTETRAVAVKGGHASFDTVLYLDCTLYGKGGRSKKYLPKTSMLLVLFSDANGAVLGKHQVDLSKLVPSCLKEPLTKRLPLTGPGGGASLVVTFGLVSESADPLDTAGRHAYEDKVTKSVAAMKMHSHVASQPPDACGERDLKVRAASDMTNRVGSDTTVKVASDARESQEREPESRTSFLREEQNGGLVNTGSSLEDEKAGSACSTTEGDEATNMVREACSTAELLEDAVSSEPNKVEASAVEERETDAVLIDVDSEEREEEGEVEKTEAPTLEEEGEVEKTEAPTVAVGPMVQELASLSSSSGTKPNEVVASATTYSSSSSSFVGSASPSPSLSSLSLASPTQPLASPPLPWPTPPSLSQAVPPSPSLPSTALTTTPTEDPEKSPIKLLIESFSGLEKGGGGGGSGSCSLTSIASGEDEIVSSLSSISFTSPSASSSAHVAEEESVHELSGDGVTPGEREILSDTGKKTEPVSVPGTSSSGVEDQVMTVEKQESARPAAAATSELVEEGSLALSVERSDQGKAGLMGPQAASGGGDEGSGMARDTNPEHPDDDGVSTGITTAESLPASGGEEEEAVMSLLASVMGVQAIEVSGLENTDSLEHSLRAGVASNEVPAGRTEMVPGGGSDQLMRERVDCKKRQEEEGVEDEEDPLLDEFLNMLVGSMSDDGRSVDGSASRSSQLMKELGLEEDDEPFSSFSSSLPTQQQRQHKPPPPPPLPPLPPPPQQQQQRSPWDYNDHSFEFPILSGAIPDGFSPPEKIRSGALTSVLDRKEYTDPCNPVVEGGAKAGGEPRGKEGAPKGSSKASLGDAGRAVRSFFRSNKSGAGAGAGAAATNKKKTRTSVELMEDKETEDLMRKFGFDKQFLESENLDRLHPDNSRIVKGSSQRIVNIAGALEAAVAASSLGVGLGSVIPTRDGGMLRMLTPHGVGGGKLVMQVSRPVVVPAEMGSDSMDIVRRMARAGVNGMVVQAMMAMPLDDLDGKKPHQVHAEAMAALEGGKYCNGLSQGITDGGRTSVVELSEGAMVKAGVSRYGKEDEENGKGREMLQLEDGRSGEEEGGSGEGGAMVKRESGGAMVTIAGKGGGTLVVRRNEQGQLVGRRMGEVGGQVVVLDEKEVVLQGGDTDRQHGGGRFAAVNRGRDLYPGELVDDCVTLEELVPMAMETIEALALEGLRIQAGISEEDAPGTMESLPWRREAPGAIAAGGGVRTKGGGGAGHVEGASNGNGNSIRGLIGGGASLLLLEDGNREESMRALGEWKSVTSSSSSSTSSSSLSSAGSAGNFMSMAISLDEWMRLDAGIADPQAANEEVMSVLSLHERAHGPVDSGILQKITNGGGADIRGGCGEGAVIAVPASRNGLVYGRSAEGMPKSGGGHTVVVGGGGGCGFMGNTLTLAMLVQLRDPLKNYEPLGAPMLAMVQAERVNVHPALLDKERVNGGGKGGPLDETDDGGMRDEPCQNPGEHHGKEDRPRFKITGIHMCGLNQAAETTSKKKGWGGQKQQQSGSRWLLANGMGPKSRHPFLKTKPVPSQTKVKEGESLWSISAKLYGSGAEWRRVAKLNPHIRNPDVIFANETLRTR